MKIAKTISFPASEVELILTLPHNTAIKLEPGDPLANISRFAA
ncbi:MAG: hypothetical protein WA633_25260 [Stellaceae bacterium]